MTLLPKDYVLMAFSQELLAAGPRLEYHLGCLMHLSAPSGKRLNGLGDEHKGYLPDEALSYS